MSSVIGTYDGRQIEPPEAILAISDGVAATDIGRVLATEGIYYYGDERVVNNRFSFRKESGEGR